MHCVLYLLCAISSFRVVSCAVALQLPVEKPAAMAQQDGCYLPQLNKVLPYNSPYSPQDGIKCVQYTCRGDNITSIFSCGSLSVSDGCAIIAGDKSLPYPDCCDKPSCNTINHKTKPA